MTAKTSEPPSAMSAGAGKPPVPSSPTCCKPETLRRHAFVRLAAQAWEHTIAEGGDISTLRDWLAEDRPLIVRRPCLSEDGQEAFLGLALPGKRRMAYRVPVEHIRSVELPPKWPGASPFLDGFTVRLFGSHAWQTLTALPYVTESSDVDLLLDIHSLEEWENLLVRGVIPPPSPRIDLEIVLRGDASFNWREYMGPAEDILIKSNRSVWLERKARLPELLR